MKKKRKLLIILVICWGVFLVSRSSDEEKKKMDFNPAYQNPPGGLLSTEVPMFVSFGFDDNGLTGLKGSLGTGGLKDIIELFAARKNNPGSGNSSTYDGQRTHFSFYPITQYRTINLQGFLAYTRNPLENPVYVKKAWRLALDNGNEIGIHTHNHPHGRELSVGHWISEIETSFSLLTQPYNGKESVDNPDDSSGIGISAAKISGFRTPFLEYNDNTFKALKRKGFVYDCSIEEGFQEDHDGTNFFWPYLLDNGSPGDKTIAKQNERAVVGDYPGLWELPVYAVIVPPDDKCSQYHIKQGFRKRLKQKVDYFLEEDGKITGFDWNLWVAFQMTKAEFLATLKYTFDLRLKGNRCPMTVGTHSDMYSDKYIDGDTPNSTAKERLSALKEFLDYVLTKPEVRVVSALELLDWIRNPVPLDLIKKE